MKIVLFKIHTREDIDGEAYSREFEIMLQQAAQHAGFINIEGYQGEDGSELALATFESEQAILEWRDDPKHVKTRQRGPR
jgi:heme-degrading monooxygenase HmoA